MKKDLVFIPILLVVSSLLCLLSVTKMTIHIIVGIIGVVTLVAYTILTKKEWKNPWLEIALRVAYGIALISGIVILKVHGIPALNIIHKISAALFIIGVIALLITKIIANKSKK